MILTESHRINRTGHHDLFKKIDAYCYCSKNLSNSVQYLICQCYRIHQKLRNAEMMEAWEHKTDSYQNRSEQHKDPAHV